MKKRLRTMMDFLKSSKMCSMSWRKRARSLTKRRRLSKNKNRNFREKYLPTKKKSMRKSSKIKKWIARLSNTRLRFRVWILIFTTWCRTIWLSLKISSASSKKITKILENFEPIWEVLKNNILRWRISMKL